MVKLAKWFYFLSKRLYKKWMFIVLICLIPVSIAALKLASTQEKGFVQIGVVNLAEDMGDKILDNLRDGKGIINYIVYSKEDVAKEDLQANKLDAVWILPENMEGRIASFVNRPDEDHYIVHVFRKEDSLKTRLALEKLSSAIYPFTSRLFYLKCVREDSDFDLSNLSDEEIYKYYDDFFTDERLFKFSFPDNNIEARQSEQDYMTSPIRGLLSVVVFLAGLASALLYIYDEKKGAFSHVKNSHRVAISFACQLAAVMNIGLFAFISMFVLGVNVSFGRELLIFLVFVINTVLFCTILQQLINRIIYFAPAMVLVSVFDILICPIFFDYTVQRIPQYLFPNAYYINSVHSNVYLHSSFIYMGSAFLVLLCIYLWKRKR